MTQVSFDTFINKARAGYLVSFPTDTVPALAVLPEKAELIFEAKQRQQDKPLILMAASADELWQFCKGSAAEFNIWQQFAASYWPGAITLVLPASEKVPKAVNPTDPTTIGLRVPNCAIACQILAQTGPMATTSANLSGQPPLQSIAEIAAQFPNVLTLIPNELESTHQAMGVPSTVAKWTNSGWEILRQGVVNLNR